MKKYLALFTILTIMFTLSVQTLHAQDKQRGVETEQLRTEMREQRNATRIEMRNRIETMRGQWREKMDSLRASIKNEKDTAKAKIKELRLQGREMALQRFDNAIERINGLKDRVNDAIERLGAKGIDTTAAENFVDTAETKLNTAGDKISQINALLVISIDELTLENKTKLGTLAQETQVLIREAHSALRDAIKSLREQITLKILN